MSLRKPIRKPVPTKQQLARRRNADDHRRAIIASGGQQINVLLDRAAAQHLAALMSHTGETKRALIARLLAEEVERRL